MRVQLIYKYHPDKNGLMFIETDLTTDQLVKGVNDKQIKLEGEGLHDSKQEARMDGKMPTITIM